MFYKNETPFLLTVPNHLMGGEIQAREYVSPVDVKQNGLIDDYSFPEQRLQQVPESENILEDSPAEELNGSLQNAVNAAQDYLSASVEEPVGEPQKHTYASIVITNTHSSHIFLISFVCLLFIVVVCALACVCICSLLNENSLIQKY